MKLGPNFWWTVYETIRAHAGEIVPESVLGEGTIFTIRLPLMQSANLEKKGF